MADLCLNQPVSLGGENVSVPEKLQDITLQMQWGSEWGKKFRVAAGQSVTIGRSLGCDIPFVHDVYISRAHFSLDWQGISCWIHDLNSRHGTFLNGRKVNNAVLSDGDTIRVGWTTLVVRLHNSVTDEPGSIRAEESSARDKGLPALEPVTAEAERPDCSARPATLLTSSSARSRRLVKS
jgi:pSer/pThr/pTyr-binding forkhead associated (FHA) protein